MSPKTLCCIVIIILACAIQVLSWSPQRHNKVVNLNVVNLNVKELNVHKIIREYKHSLNGGRSLSKALLRDRESGTIGLAALNRHRPIKRADISNFILDCSASGITVDIDRSDDCDYDQFIPLGFSICDVDVCSEENCAVSC